MLTSSRSVARIWASLIYVLKRLPYITLALFGPRAKKLLDFLIATQIPRIIADHR